MNKNKQQEIADLESKGAEWLAKTLYAERSKYADIRERCRSYRYQTHVDFDLSDENDNAAEVLRENGIKPIRLVVTYIANRCQDCPIDECYYYNECTETGKRHTATMSFWSFDISENNISGILQNFKTFENEVISIKDRDGFTIWEADTK